MPPRILVFASINIDLTSHVDRLPRPGETLLTNRATTCPGGKGANQAVAAHRLGAEVGIVCCVGDDLQGQRLRHDMEVEEIELVGWHVDPHRPTGAAMIMVLPCGENAIVVASGANRALGPSHVDAAFDQPGTWDFVMVTMETPLETVRRIAERTGRLGIPWLLDAGGHTETLRGDQLLSSPSALTANETELAHLTGREVTDLDSAVRAMAELMAPLRFIKMGALGTLCQDGRRPVIHTPAFEIRATDTVAAGDAHSAALVTGWVERTLHRRRGGGRRSTVCEVLRFANAVGALTCTRPGAMPSLPTRDEVESFLVDFEAR